MGAGAAARSRMARWVYASVAHRPHRFSRVRDLPSRQIRQTLISHRPHLLSPFSPHCALRICLGHGLMGVYHYEGNGLSMHEPHFIDTVKM